MAKRRSCKARSKKHPEALSIPAVGAIVPLTTEYPINTGSVDLLAFNEGGRIYLIETKLHKNYDKRGHSPS